MLELPQSISPEKLMSYSICGKHICNVITMPNSRLRFYGKSKEISKLLAGKTIESFSSLRGLTQFKAGKMLVLFSDGVKLRYYESNRAKLFKHDFVIEFTDGSSLTASAELYGAIWCYEEDELSHPYLGAQI